MASIAEAAAELRDIARGFEAAPPRVAKDMGTVVSAVAHRIEGTAKVLAPVDTGALMNSIGTEETREADKATAEVGTDIEYSAYVELGTRNMAPQPYLGPAFDRHVDEFTKALQAIVVPEGFR